MEQLDSGNGSAFGHGRNDGDLLRGIVIAVASKAHQAADVLAPGPIEAHVLVLKPKRLSATLRG